ncbi:MAG TPA: hypothetical protein VFQ79_21715 [Bryobacteraceae bacterium]|nr:hypothetical protein [Bryobacteraceae bacterium]
MKTIAILSLLVLVASSAQIQPRGKWKWTLSASPVAKGAGPQTYRFTCDYYYLDTKGNPGRRERVSALYLRDLPEDRVRWSGVEIAESSGSSGNFGPARKCDFMEGFSYARASLKDMLAPGFFRGFPPTAMFERNLVWDTHMIENFGQDYFPDLKLNIPFHVPQSGALSLAGAGTVTLKDLQLIWTGISQRNGQECAVIDYRAFLNTLDMKMPEISIVAGSNFWGQIWVSLGTKRIEYGTLNEGVVGEMSVQDQKKPWVVNIFRMGVFEPVNNK